MHLLRNVTAALISATLLAGCGGGDAPTDAAAKTLNRTQLKDALGALSGTLVNNAVASAAVRAPAAPAAFRSHPSP